MPSEVPLVSLLPAEVRQNPDYSGLIRQLLEAQAERVDQTLRNKLLTDLVLKYSKAERELSLLNAALRDKQARIEADLLAAAAIQKALLPPPLPAQFNIRANWKFIPSERIGGDIFLLTPIGNRFLMVAIIDISGHGVPSAMVTVSICQFLQPLTGIIQTAGPAGPHPVAPDAVLEAIDREFPYRRFKKTMSVFYGVIDQQTGQFSYANAGHPFPIHLALQKGIRPLEEHGPIIGMGMGGGFPKGDLPLTAGDRLFFYTDGLSECRSPSGDLFGEERILSLIEGGAGEPLAKLVERVHLAAEQFATGGTFQDDFSFLGLEFIGSTPTP